MNVDFRLAQDVSVCQCCYTYSLYALVVASTQVCVLCVVGFPYKILSIVFATVFRFIPISIALPKIIIEFIIIAGVSFGYYHCIM